jgi:hypothetical protein
MPKQWSDAVFLRYPTCTIGELAALLGSTEKALDDRYRMGEVEHLVMRTVAGEEWRPGTKKCFDATRVRASLDEEGQRRFDAWQRGELLLPAAQGTAAHEDAGFRPNAQTSP